MKPFDPSPQGTERRIGRLAKAIGFVVLAFALIAALNIALALVMSLPVGCFAFFRWVWGKI